MGNIRFFLVVFTSLCKFSFYSICLLVLSYLYYILNVVCKHKMGKYYGLCRKNLVNIALFVLALLIN